jgi:hypothetical protein
VDATARAVAAVVVLIAGAVVGAVATSPELVLI